MRLKCVSLTWHELTREKELNTQRMKNNYHDIDFKYHKVPYETNLIYVLNGYCILILTGNFYNKSPALVIVCISFPV